MARRKSKTAIPKEVDGNRPNDYNHPINPFGHGQWRAKRFFILFERAGPTRLQVVPFLVLRTGKTLHLPRDPPNRGTHSPAWLLPDARSNSHQHGLVPWYCRLPATLRNPWLFAPAMKSIDSFRPSENTASTKPSLSSILSRSFRRHTWHGPQLHRTKADIDLPSISQSQGWSSVSICLTYSPDNRPFACKSYQ
jgi:hypothetical protein